MKHRKQNGCGKVCFAGPNHAMKASRGQHRRIRAYFCRECRAWHITSHEAL